MVWPLVLVGSGYAGWPIGLRLTGSKSFGCRRRSGRAGRCEGYRPATDLGRKTAVLFSRLPSLLTRFASFESVKRFFSLKWL